MSAPGTVVGAPHERKSFDRRCPHCGEAFTTSNPRQHYCREGHQRAAANARYRARHTERVPCRGCGLPFERSAVAHRAQTYCSTTCQYETRSTDYKRRGIRPPAAEKEETANERVVIDEFGQVEGHPGLSALRPGGADP